MSIWVSKSSKCYTCQDNVHTLVKGSQIQKIFDTPKVKQASQLSCDASPEAYLSPLTSSNQMSKLFCVTTTHQVKHHRIIVKPF
jgi:hypothetical protein